MDSKHTESQNLPQFLTANTSAIIDRWATVTLPKLSLPPSRKLSFEEFRDDVPGVLKMLAAFLENQGASGESPPFDAVADQHGHCRWRQGFNLKDLIRDWGNLQRVVLEWVNDFYEAEAGRAQSTATNLVTEFFTEAVSSSVARFDELRQKEAARMGDELQRMRHHFDRIDEFRKHLLKNLSHDIRSPLTAISGASSILKGEENGDESEAGEASQELGMIIEESVTDAMALLESLRELSQIDSGLAELSLSRVDVHALLREVLDERSALGDDTAETGAIALSGAESLEVEADADRLRKTFQRFISIPGRNGKAKSAPVEEVSLRRMEDSWELQVRYASTVIGGSEGEGVSREDINTPILRRLCMLQLASFQIEERSGGGQTVTLTFPLDYREVG